MASINKVVYGGNVLIDLTADTVTSSTVLSGYKFHAADGSIKTGGCSFNVDASNATAVADEVLSGKTFASGNSIQTGSMTNVGQQIATISTRDDSVLITKGFHDGSGYATISAVERAKIIPNNIREGVTMLGIVGTMSGAESEVPQTKDVTPSVSAQTIVPDEGYTCLRQVNVAAIPYAETANAAGGITVTIAA